MKNYLVFAVILPLFFLTCKDGASTALTTLKIKNESFTELTDVIWQNISFCNNDNKNAIEIGTNVVRNVEPGSGYIFFKRKSNPIIARTRDLVIVDKNEQVDFVFNDNTIIAEVNKPNNFGTLGSLENESSYIYVPGINLVSKLTWLQTNAESDFSYLVEINNNEYIREINLSYPGKNNVTVILRGTDLIYTISLSETGFMFTVASGVTLILSNNIILHGRNTNTNSLIIVKGKLEMKGNARITGNFFYSTTGSTNGGAVFIDSGAHFVMRDSSEISGNAAIASGSTTLGGGYGTPVKIYHCGKGGGVYNNSNGTMDMYNNSTITNNSVTVTTDGGGGGGVFNQGVLRINGGRINNNSSTTGTRINLWGDGKAEYGTFNGTTFLPIGIINSDKEIIVVNGVLK